ncbi:MAG TPA: cysteine synthase family protein [Paucimonas sp.]|nr:cysteine synthase family protein [Paucimonas sp.]
MLANKIDQLIGGTPLIRLNCISNDAKGINVYGKLESINPGYSVKDRSALQMIEQARNDYKLQEGWTIVESSSGNMGHALAMLCAAYKFRFICVLDPKTPKSNVSLVKAYGGEVEMVTVPDENGSFQKKRIELARTIAKRLPNCVNLDQYNNPAAVDAHFKHTGPEIYSDVGGNIDVLIGSASTGSHLSGTAKYLKTMNPRIHVIGVEPVGSVVFGGEFKPFLQNGTGLSFKPGNIRTEYVDEVVKVADIDAFAACRRIARTEGLLLGGSSGSVIHAAQVYLSKVRSPCNVVVVLPDGGLKYIDTIYNDQWLISNNLGSLVRGAEPVPHESHSQPLPVEEQESVV